ncbi:MAG: hypothetical protein J2P57_14225 [Acidimicrobiaceae bacterium]|nr:hypothetical protein [Acidimicrobiaceae bacterium]
MTDQNVNVELEFHGDPARPIKTLSAGEATDALVALEGTHDVTMTISDSGRNERLLVAVDGSCAFLGLERSDGLLQFESGDPGQKHVTKPFTIGGQESEIETQYLVDIEMAAAVVRDWLDGVDPSSHGAWELR